MATQIVSHPGIKSNRAANIGLWAFQIGLALFLGYAGWMKLSGNPQMVQMFGVIGFGQWFRYLTGTLEVVGAVGLLIPRFAGYAAALLVAVMVGAVATHLFILGGSPILPVLLGLVAAMIAWFRFQLAR